MQNNIAVLLPYKDQFIKDNAGSASIWVKDFSKDSYFKKNTTIFGYTSNVSKTFDNFNSCLSKTLKKTSEKKGLAGGCLL